MEKKAKILIIDDEMDLRENLKYVFQMKGYAVEVAEDGVQGLKKLETCTPDLIILDLNMPNMGGIEFYQHICERDVPKYPVFVLTARANMEQFFKDFNVDGFMAKPFEIPELLNEVMAIIEKKNAQVQHNLQKTVSYKKIFIVENDEIFSAKLGMAFLSKGFTVNLAKSGTEAIERMSSAVPEVACIKMNLTDIPGDMVISKLKRMVKTSEIRFILFTYGMAEREIVADIIQHKLGVDKFIVANSEKDLIDAVESL